MKKKEWKPPPPPPPVKFGVCPDCGATIMEGDSVWWMLDRIVCLHHWRDYSPIGHMDWAGFTLPGLEDIIP